MSLVYMKTSQKRTSQIGRVHKNQKKKKNIASPLWSPHRRAQALDPTRRASVCPLSAVRNDPQLLTRVESVDTE
jgi:hypothetical protein